MHLEIIFKNRLVDNDKKKLHICNCLLHFLSFTNKSITVVQNVVGGTITDSGRSYYANEQGRLIFTSTNERGCTNVRFLPADLDDNVMISFYGTNLNKITIHDRCSDLNKMNGIAFMIVHHFGVGKISVIN